MDPSRCFSAASANLADCHATGQYAHQAHFDDETFGIRARKEMSPPSKQSWLYMTPTRIVLRPDMCLSSFTKHSSVQKEANHYGAHHALLSKLAAQVHVSLGGCQEIRIGSPSLVCSSSLQLLFLLSVRFRTNHVAIGSAEIEHG